MTTLISMFLRNIAGKRGRAGKTQCDKKLIKSTYKV